MIGRPPDVARGAASGLLGFVGDSPMKCTTGPVKALANDPVRFTLAAGRVASLRGTIVGARGGGIARSLSVETPGCFARRAFIFPT